MVFPVDLCRPGAAVGLSQVLLQWLCPLERFGECIWGLSQSQALDFFFPFQICFSPLLLTPVNATIVHPVLQAKFLAVTRDFFFLPSDPPVSQRGPAPLTAAQACRGFSLFSTKRPMSQEASLLWADGSGWSPQPAVAALARLA